VGVKLYWGRLMRLLRIRKPEAEAEPEPAKAAAAEPTPVGGPKPAERAIVESQSQ
jgi:hypothetical protein